MPIIPTFAITLLINTLIAGLLTTVGFGYGFALNLLFSQCFGLSICAFTTLAFRLTRPGLQRLLAMVLAIIIGSALGYYLAVFLADQPAPAGKHEAIAILLGLFFGGVVSIFFYLRERNTSLQTELREREIQQLASEKSRIEAQLKMLQAQIEPHFLFNTLSNVAVLIDSDQKTAGQLLAALIHYLRASLVRTRAENASLGDEVSLLTAYLEILKIRLGERLAYTFAIAPELLALPFPPMLLQPLVENAIIHAIEPKRDGGAITIAAERGDQQLVLTVSDNGGGLTGIGGSGVGLANIRARLETLYAGAARLELSENMDGGVSASIRIPA